MWDVGTKTSKDINERYGDVAEAGVLFALLLEYDPSLIK